MMTTRHEQSRRGGTHILSHPVSGRAFAPISGADGNDDALRGLSVRERRGYQTVPPS